MFRIPRFSRKASQGRRTVTLSATTLGVVFALLTATTLSQNLPEMDLAGQVDGTYPTGPAFFGSELIVPGDLDGDGVDDFIVSAHFNPFYLSASEVRAISGATLSTLYSLVGTSLGNVVYGLSLGVVGDVDLDGISDFGSLEKTPLSGGFGYSVTIRSGASGAAIFAIPGFIDTRNVTGVGDQNGDGIPEIAVGPTFSATVIIVDGATGVTLQSLTSTQSGYGYSGLRNLGDLNGDGRDDLAVLSGGTSYQSNSIEILVSSVSGFVPVHSATYGTAAWIGIAPATDLDLDGLPDYFLSVVQPIYTGIPSFLEARSGATHMAIWSAPNPPGLGWVLGGIGVPTTMSDINGDAICEVALTVAQVPGANGELTQRVLVYSGLDGRPIMQATLEPIPGSYVFGVSPNLARMESGDFNGDGLADLVVPEPLGNSGHGHVQVYLSPNSFDPMTAAGNVVDPNGVPVDVLKVGLAGTGTASSGGPTRAVLVPVGTNAAVWVEGASSTPASLSSYAVFGKVLLGDGEQTYSLPLGVGPMCFTPEIFDPYGTDLLFTLINTFGGWPSLLSGSPVLLPAQSLQVASTGPIPFPVAFWLQGFLTDYSKPWPFLSVTNAIRVVVR